MEVHRMPTVPNPKPFYAYVGAGEAALTRLRTRVTALPTTLKTVPALAQTLPQQAKELQAALSKQREGFGSKAEKLYDEFAARGEKIVTDLRGGKVTAKPATTKTSTAKPTAKKPTTVKAAAKPAPTTAGSTTPVPTQPVVPPAATNASTTTQDGPLS
jgi:hypothetical protein